MSDLVDRLRKDPAWDQFRASMLMAKAADRIEQLERVLALAKMALEYHTQQTRPIHGTAQTITAIDEALNHQASG